MEVRSRGRRGRGADQAMMRAWRRTLPGDLVAAGVSALVSICYSISFAAMIFSGNVAADLPVGVAMALVSAGITGALVAALSPFPFAMAGPDSRAAAVQSALAAGVATLAAGVDSRSATVPFALALSTALTGAVLWVM